MNSPFFNHRLFILLIFAGLGPGVFGQSDSAGNPNIVLILVDDSGLMDFGAYGGEVRTPNIDRLAKNGMMFTNLHSSPVCAPSRAMLMTGSDSHLTGVANLPEMLPEEVQRKPGYGGVLNDRVQTIATRLKEANYNTYVSGKWHLGHDENTLPTKRGFDRSFILGGSGADNYEARGYLPQRAVVHWYADGKEVDLPPDFYSSKTYIDKAISFHQEEKNKENPFFSYIAFQAIHTPVQAPREFVEPYLDTYAEGWDALIQKRFQKAKQMGLIPEEAPLNEVFPQYKKWDELDSDSQKDFVVTMAIMAGMLEAMDYHIGRYVEFLTKEGMMENTVFIITSDNGPDGGDYSVIIPWAYTLGYNRDFDKYGGEGYFGFIGTEFANALSSPFSYFKYYPGEGGLRVPLIISGKNIPQNVSSDEFSFFTDIAPTIYDMVGLSTSAKEGYAPITGKSILPHIHNPDQPIYKPDEGIGLEAANSAAYFLNGYKIVKNNIPHGDNRWHLYHLESDPGEAIDIASRKPELFQRMLSAYEDYAKTVGVVKMEKGYSAQGKVRERAIIQLLKNAIPYALMVVVFVIGIFILRNRRKRG